MFLVSYETVTTKTDPFRSVSIQLAQRQPRQDVPRHTSSASVSVSGTAMGAVQLVAGRLGSVWPCRSLGMVIPPKNWGLLRMVQQILYILQYIYILSSYDIMIHYV